MDKKNFAKLLYFQKHPAFPFLVGFGVACVHFVVTPMLSTSIIVSLGDFIWFILVAPGYMLVFALDSLLSSVSEFIDSSILETFLQLFSSMFYGIVVGFLVSKKIYFRLVALILVFLSILFACYLGLLAGLSFA